MQIAGRKKEREVFLGAGDLSLRRRNMRKEILLETKFGRQEEENEQRRGGSASGGKEGQARVRGGKKKKKRFFFLLMFQVGEGGIPGRIARMWCCILWKILLGEVKNLGIAR